MTDIIANLGQQRLAGARARHRHTWYTEVYRPMGVNLVRCVSCGVEQDPAKSRAGTSARRLGHDQERRIERVYGPRKVGEFGDAIDLLGRDFMWQSKATRAAPPSTPADWWPMPERAYITNPIGAMCRLRSDRMPLLIRSWVRQGVPVTDVVIVRAIDWANLHGPKEGVRDYLAMTGAYFLDVHGRDEP